MRYVGCGGQSYPHSPAGQHHTAQRALAVEAQRISNLHWVHPWRYRHHVPQIQLLHTLLRKKIDYDYNDMIANGSV